MIIYGFLQNCSSSKNVVIAKEKKKKASFYVNFRTFFCHKTLVQACGALSIFTGRFPRAVYQVLNKITYTETCYTRKMMQKLGYESGKAQVHQACVFLCFPVSWLPTFPLTHITWAPDPQLSRSMKSFVSLLGNASHCKEI